MVVGVTPSLPLRPFVPLHPPEAVQLVALVLDQVRVLAWPLVMDVGVAVRVSVGAVGGGGGRY